MDFLGKGWVIRFNNNRCCLLIIKLRRNIAFFGCRDWPDEVIVSLCPPKVSTILELDCDNRFRILSAKLVGLFNCVVQVIKWVSVPSSNRLNICRRILVIRIH